MTKIYIYCLFDTNDQFRGVYSSLKAIHRDALALANRGFSKVYLVNTGWVGGSPTSGASRISIQNTRNIITSILDGNIEESNFIKEQHFGLLIPESLKNVDSEILFPENMWSDKDGYKRMAANLSAMFKENFKQYGSEVEDLEEHGPKVL